MSLRFLLDEHVNRAVQRQFRRIAPAVEILAVGDAGAPPTGSPDPVLLRWLEVHAYVLVTEDRSTMPAHLSEHFLRGGHVPGVIWIRPRIGVGQIIEDLHLIWATTTEDEFRDRTLFIPL